MRGDVEERGGGRAGPAAEVEDPQSGPLAGKPQPGGRAAQVGVVAGVGGDEAVVDGSGAVEFCGDPVLFLGLDGQRQSLSPE